MSHVLHIFDASVCPSALGQLALVRAGRGGDELVRIGTDADRADLPRPDHALRAAFGRAVTAVPALRDLARRRGASVLHCWAPSLAAAAAATGLPTLVSLFRPPTGGQEESLRLAVADGAVLLASGEHLAGQLSAVTGGSQAVQTVAPATERVDRSVGRQEAREALGLADLGPVLLALPQVNQGQAMRWCVWSMAIVRQIVPSIRLVLAGTGATVDRGVDFARDTRFLAETIAPRQSADTAVLLAAADMVMLCEPDGYGLAQFAQATAAGLPAIAVDAGEFRAELSDGRTALLARSASPRSISRAIWLLHSRPGLAEGLAAAAARQFGERIAPARLIGQLESLYSAAASRPRTLASAAS